MYAARSHVRAALLSRAGRSLLVQPCKRRFATVLAAPNEVARRLRDEGTWSIARSRRKGKNKDKYRVNVVSEKLCDDIVNYIKPTLARHEGCDLIDIFPGAGLWSKTLNDLLRPRSHLLLEPDEDFYRPHLAPLLDRPGVKLLPESGIVWEQLNTVLNPTFLPHQVERKYTAEEEPPRNDTLLVTMNLCMLPKRKFRTFDSLAQLVLFQLVSSIRPGALFQKYGLVRMLIWLTDDEKGAILPRTVQRRKKMAIEAELATEHLYEIAGGEIEDTGLAKSANWFRRDVTIDLESTRDALERMRRNGFVMPPDRTPLHVQEYMGLSPAGIQNAQTAERSWRAELERLEADLASGVSEPQGPQQKRLSEVQKLLRWASRRNETIAGHVREYEAARMRFIEAGSDRASVQKATRELQDWIDTINALPKGLRGEVILHRDNVHVLRQDPPVMNWDRRYVEPLRVRPDEFFPQTPCCLLDVQPKAAAPLLRDMGPASGRGGDTFDLILRGLTLRFAEPVSKALDSLYAGAGEGVYELCPSLSDPALGGSPLSGSGEVTTRTLSERQLVEIAHGWMKWPFKPTYSELVSRTFEEVVTDDGEESAVGGNFHPDTV